MLVSLANSLKRFSPYASEKVRLVISLMSAPAARDREPTTQVVFVCEQVRVRTVGLVKKQRTQR